MLAELTDCVRQVGLDLMRKRQEAQMGRGGPLSVYSDVDAWADERLQAWLQKLEPRLPIVSEERPESQHANRPPRYWLVDPIDGTASFSDGYTGFVVQVALMDNHIPLLAAVFAPALHRCYVAEAGRGAFVNGVRIESSPVYPHRVLVDNYPTPRGITREAFDELGFQHYIESGSIGLKICMVAEGQADVFFKDVLVRDWDLAAPHRVLMEAGGVLTDIEGEELSYAGSYVRRGLVAALHRRSHGELVEWYRKRASRR